jgi:hypothetical protein
MRAPLSEDLEGRKRQIVMPTFAAESGSSTLAVTEVFDSFRAGVEALSSAAGGVRL